MNILTRTILGLSASVAFSVSAYAQTVDFGGLGGSNGAAFAGPYVEDGYTISTTGGQVFEGQAFGNPTPNLVVGGVFGGGNLGVIEATSALTFSLVSFDLSAQNGTSGYLVEGFLGALGVYSFGGSAGSGFTTYGGNASLVDRVRFTLTPTGSSVNIDNLVFRTAAAVPEPGTWALLLIGFGMTGFALRRKKIDFALASA